MDRLNFKNYTFRIQEIDSKRFIFDPIRKKFVALQPEEWVRQHIIRFLAEEKGYPLSLMNVEKELVVGELTKRYDVVVFTPEGRVHLVVECKAPSIRIRQAPFDQIARYNLALKAPYLMVRKGIQHYFCKVDYEKNQYCFIEDLPHYKSFI